MRSTQRLTRLITDVLDLSRLEAGILKTSCCPFDLRSVADSVEQLLCSTARQKGIALTVRVDPAAPDLVAGDIQRVQQVMDCLAGNAVKFTESGKVTLEISSIPAAPDGMLRILFVISDTGIGIPDERLPHLFEPFSQVAEGFTRAYQGAGLGLAIVKRLVSSMGGNMSVCSEQGFGTSVCVSLPFGRVPLGESRQERIKALAARNDLGFRVLLAEDDPVSQFATTRQLERLGCVVVAVDNGQDALERLLSADFDIVLMDVQMPLLDGMQATRIVRASSEFRRKSSIPVVALTAYTLDEDVRKFREAGMDMHIAKPVHMENLVEAMMQCIMERDRA